MRALTRLTLLLAALALSGCGAVSSLSRASEQLDTYTLSPLPGTGGGGSRHIVVEAATAGGALATDRILIKPSRVQALYLPDARWSDPRPRSCRRCWWGPCRTAAASGSSRARRRASCPITRS